MAYWKWNQRRMQTPLPINNTYYTQQNSLSRDLTQSRQPPPPLTRSDQYGYYSSQPRQHQQSVLGQYRNYQPQMYQQIPSLLGPYNSVSYQSYRPYSVPFRTGNCDFNRQSYHQWSGTRGTQTVIPRQQIHNSNHADTLNTKQQVNCSNETPRVNPKQAIPTNKAETVYSKQWHCAYQSEAVNLKPQLHRARKAETLNSKQQVHYADKVEAVNSKQVYKAETLISKQQAYQVNKAETVNSKQQVYYVNKVVTLNSKQVYRVNNAKTVNSEQVHNADKAKSMNSKQQVDYVNKAKTVSSKQAHHANKAKTVNSKQAHHANKAETLNSEQQVDYVNEAKTVNSEQAHHANKAAPSNTKELHHADKAKTLNSEQVHRANKAETLNSVQVHRANKAETLNSKQVHRANKAETLNSKQVHLANKAKTVNSKQAHHANKAETLNSKQLHLANKAETLNSKQAHSANKAETLNSKQAHSANKAETLNSKQLHHANKAETLNSKQLHLANKAKTVNSKQAHHANKAETLNSKQLHLANKAKTVNSKQEHHANKAETLNSKQQLHYVNEAKSVNPKQVHYANKRGTVNSNQVKHSCKTTLNKKQHIKNAEYTKIKDSSDKANNVNQVIKSDNAKRKISVIKIDRKNLPPTSINKEHVASTRPNKQNVFSLVTTKDKSPKTRCIIKEIDLFKDMVQSPPKSKNNGTKNDEASDCSNSIPSLLDKSFEKPPSAFDDSWKIPKIKTAEKLCQLRQDIPQSEKMRLQSVGQKISRFMKTKVKCSNNEKPSETMNDCLKSKMILKKSVVDTLRKQLKERKEKETNGLSTARISDTPSASAKQNTSNRPLLRKKGPSKIPEKERKQICEPMTNPDQSELISLGDKNKLNASLANTNKSGETELVSKDDKMDEHNPNVNKCLSQQKDASEQIRDDHVANEDLSHTEYDKDIDTLGTEPEETLNEVAVALKNYFDETELTDDSPKALSSDDGNSSVTLYELNTVSARNDASDSVQISSLEHEDVFRENDIDTFLDVSSDTLEMNMKESANALKYMDEKLFDELEENSDELRFDIEHCIDLLNNETSKETSPSDSPQAQTMEIPSANSQTGDPTQVITAQETGQVNSESLTVLRNEANSDRLNLTSESRNSNITEQYIHKESITGTADTASSGSKDTDNDNVDQNNNIVDSGANESENLKRKQEQDFSKGKKLCEGTSLSSVLSLETNVLAESQLAQVKTSSVNVKMDNIHQETLIYHRSAFVSNQTTNKVKEAKDIVSEISPDISEALVKESTDLLTSDNSICQTRNLGKEKHSEKGSENDTQVLQNNDTVRPSNDKCQFVEHSKIIHLTQDSDMVSNNNFKTNDSTTLVLIKHEESACEGGTCMSQNTMMMESDYAIQDLPEDYESSGDSSLCDIKEFKCPNCAYSSSYIRFFKRHIAHHKNVGLLKCDLCSYSTNKSVSLKRHFRWHKFKKSTDLANEEAKSSHYATVDNIKIIKEEAKVIKEEAKVTMPDALEVRKLTMDEKMLTIDEANLSLVYPLEVRRLVIDEVKSTIDEAKVSPNDAIEDENPIDEAKLTPYDTIEDRNMSTDEAKLTTLHIKDDRKLKDEAKLGVGAMKPTMDEVIVLEPNDSQHDISVSDISTDSSLPDVSSLLHIRSHENRPKSNGGVTRKVDKGNERKKVSQTKTVKRSQGFTVIQKKRCRSSSSSDDLPDI